MPLPLVTEEPTQVQMLARLVVTDCLSFLTPCSYVRVLHFGKVGAAQPQIHLGAGDAAWVCSLWLTFRGFWGPGWSVAIRPEQVTEAPFFQPQPSAKRTP